MIILSLCKIYMFYCPAVDNTSMLCPLEGAADEQIHLSGFTLWLPEQDKIMS